MEAKNATKKLVIVMRDGTSFKLECKGENIEVIETSSMFGIVELKTFRRKNPPSVPTKEFKALAVEE